MQNLYKDRKVKLRGIVLMQSTLCLLIPLRVFLSWGCLDFVSCVRFLPPHNINHSPIRSPTLQRHWKQACVHQEGGCLLGTTRVCPISRARSSSPHSFPQPARKIGHSSHQPSGHTFHPAVSEVHS